MSDVVEELTGSLLESLRECRELKRRVEHLESSAARAEKQYEQELAERDRKYNADTGILKLQVASASELYAEESDRAEKLEAKVKELEWQVEELVKQIPSEGNQPKEFEGYRQLLDGEVIQDGDMLNRIGDTALYPVTSGLGWNVYGEGLTRYYRKIEGVPANVNMRRLKAGEVVQVGDFIEARGGKLEVVHASIGYAVGSGSCPGVFYRRMNSNDDQKDT